MNTPDLSNEYNPVPKPVKVEKEKKGLNKTRKSPLGLAKKKAWDAFSLYVRLKDAVEEINVCYTCGKLIHYKECNAGHGIGGRNNAVLFDIRIVKPQCPGCNIWGRGQYQIFTRKLIDELGLEGYDKVVTEARNPIKYKLEDYRAIEEHYKELVSEL
jgi:hypothetical protein